MPIILSFFFFAVVNSRGTMNYRVTTGAICLLFLGDPFERTKSNKRLFYLVLRFSETKEGRQGDSSNDNKSWGRCRPEGLKQL